MNEYIAVDWGSTQLRAWRMRDGECIDKLKLPCGVTRLNGQRAEAVFQQQLAPWRGDPALPVVMAGMIGSDAGWQPVPYLACPLALEALNGQLYEVAEKVWIVPGLKVAQAADYDVMRGEETQLLGAWQLMPAECYVMPGTHCKWVQVQNGVVRQFATAMTGELHHLLLNHSLLGQQLPAQFPDEASFALGIEKGLNQPALLSGLFSARAARVLGSLRALKAVLPPEVPVLAVGGVTPESLATWIQAGCAGAGLGSDLYRAGQAVERTREQAERFISASKS
ncbi:2-dehydro-3-deoxygalactonokinase [Klebsiella pneumoniae]